MNETGVRRIHSRRCKTRTSGAACSCNGSWQAAVVDLTTGRRLRRNFSTRAAAKLWRAEALSGAAHALDGMLEGPTLREAGEHLLENMETGRARGHAPAIRTSLPRFGAT